MNKIIFVLLALVAYASAHVCMAEGDPHFRTFGGHAFDFYATGEYILFKKDGFQCNTRLQTSNKYWVGRSLNAGIACSVKGVHFEVEVVGHTTAIGVYLNKQKNFAGTKTINGATAFFQGNNFGFKYGQMEMKGNIQNIPNDSTLKRYLNLYVYSHNAASQGLCQNQKLKATKTMFHHGKPPQFRQGVKRKLNPDWVKWAEKECVKHFPKGSFSYKACVTDMAETKKRRVAGQLEKFSEIVKGDFKRVCHKTHCHYYKKVTKTHTKRWATTHKKTVTVVDHHKRSNAIANADNHRHAANQLIRKKELDIINARCNANKKINQLQHAIDNVEHHYKKTLRQWNDWQHSIKNSAKSSFEATKKQYTNWKRSIKQQADTHHKNTVKHWTEWKAKQVKHAEAQLKNIHKWKRDRYTYADKHYKTVIESKRKWVHSRNHYADSTRKAQIDNITKWRQNQLKALNAQIKAVRDQTSKTVDRLNHTYSSQINRHHSEIKRWNGVEKSATKKVTKQYKKWHTKKVTTHQWKHVAHHTF